VFLATLFRSFYRMFVASMIRASSYATAAVLLLLSTAAYAATTCQTVSYKYDDKTECGGLKGNSEFEVKRCANTAQEVIAHLQQMSRLKDHTADTCKLMWLTACATFPLSDVVVVPKSIKCNNVMCDQSTYYSNCVTDADCSKVASVEAGLPAPTATWPMAGNLTDILPPYRPCCEFYNMNCNGAKGPAIQEPGEDKPYTPAERAEKQKRCVWSSSSESPCWSVKPKG